MVKNITPAKVWHGIKPSVEHFHVFGCIAHVHVLEVQRMKFDSRSVKCIFLGVCEESKGYRLFNPITKRVVVSRDVIFEKEKQWDWDENSEKQMLVDLEWGDSDGEGVDGVNDNYCSEDSSEDNEGNACAEHRDSEDNEGDVCTDNKNNEDNEGGMRMRQAPAWIKDYVTRESLSSSEGEDLTLLMSSDSLHYEEAVTDANRRLAMDNEIKSIEKNKTWTLVTLPVEVKKIGVKWIYKSKYNEHEELEKRKTRLVAKRYTQKHGIDYTEVYDPVARIETMRIIVALAAQRNLNVFQMDVKSTFFHGELNEDVYVEQPKGYEVKGSEDKVYKLYKALYGLKQAPQAWFSRIENYFISEGFGKCSNDKTLFTKRS